MDLNDFQINGNFHAFLQRNWVGKKRGEFDLPQKSCKSCSNINQYPRVLSHFANSHRFTKIQSCIEGLMNKLFLNQMCANKTVENDNIEEAS